MNVPTIGRKIKLNQNPTHHIPWRLSRYAVAEEQKKTILLLKRMNHFKMTDKVRDSQSAVVGSEGAGIHVHVGPSVGPIVSSPLKEPRSYPFRD